MYARFGPLGAQGIGAVNPLVANIYGQLIVQSAGGKHQEAALAGRLFAAANVAVITTVAGCTAAAWTGLGIANPVGSGVTVIVHEFAYAMYILTTGAGHLSLGTTSSSGAAASIVPRNRSNGGPASKVYASAGWTITPAGVIEQYIASLPHGAATVDWGATPSKVDLDSSIVLNPGFAVITVTDIVQTTVFGFSFLWEEIPYIARY